jgi:transposase
MGVAIAEIDAEVEGCLLPFREALRRLRTIPDVSDLSAQGIVSEIGTDMSRFPTAGHLISWAGLCSRNDESAGKRRSTRLGCARGHCGSKPPSCSAPGRS